MIWKADSWHYTKNEDFLQKSRKGTLLSRACENKR